MFVSHCGFGCYIRFMIQRSRPLESRLAPIQTSTVVIPPGEAELCSANHWLTLSVAGGAEAAAAAAAAAAARARSRSRLINWTS